MVGALDLVARRRHSEQEILRQAGDDPSHTHLEEMRQCRIETEPRCLPTCQIENLGGGKAKTCAAGGDKFDNGFRAKPFDKRDGAFEPALRVKHQMLRANAKPRRARRCLALRDKTHAFDLKPLAGEPGTRAVGADLAERAIEEIHLRRAKEAGDEFIGRHVEQIHRMATLFTLVIDFK